MTSRKPTKNHPTSFIRKTFKILSKPKVSNIISWNEDGQSFTIKDLHAFTNKILPEFFKHKNFSSFVRQLNMYDFHKIKEDSLEFSHPLFQKDNYASLNEIHRKVTEPTVYKESANELGKRLKKFQCQQNTMEEMLETLEKQYDQIVEQNQILICELMQSKQREKRIEMYIQKIEQRKKDDNKADKSESPDEKEKTESDEFLKLSPLSSEE